MRKKEIHNIKTTKQFACVEDTEMCEQLEENDKIDEAIEEAEIEYQEHGILLDADDILVRLRREKKIESSESIEDVLASLIGIVPDDGKSLAEYREERILKKFEE